MILKTIKKKSSVTAPMSCEQFMECPLKSCFERGVGGRVVTCVEYVVGVDVGVDVAVDCNVVWTCRICELC